MDESMASGEDKNLNGIPDSDEVVNPGVADGNATSEEGTEVSSDENETESTDVAPAESEGEGEVSEEVTSDSVPEEVVSLSLQFGEKTVGLDITDDFAVDFPTLCNEIGARPDAFEYEGEVSAEIRMTLIKACK